jgi:hypothetical protein
MRCAVLRVDFRARDSNSTSDNPAGVASACPAAGRGRVSGHPLGRNGDAVVSTQEIFAAFIADRTGGAGRGPDQSPLEWVGERAARAGLAPRVATEAAQNEDLSYGSALPYMEGDWLGMPVELRFVEGEDYQALVVVAGHAAFVRRVGRSSGAFLENVVSAFRDACDEIAPAYAYLVTTPEDDIPGRLKQVAVDVRDADPRALPAPGLPLMYLDEALATAGKDRERAERPSVRVPARRGVVLVAGESLTGWL